MGKGKPEKKPEVTKGGKPVELKALQGKYPGHGPNCRCLMGCRMGCRTR